MTTETLTDLASKLRHDELEDLTTIADALVKKRRVFGLIDVNGDGRNFKADADWQLRDAIERMGQRLVRAGK